MAHEHEHHAHGDDHAGHGHEDEAFPRLAVSELVGDAESSRIGRERWQSWLLGLGLATLALGLPRHDVSDWSLELVVATAERLESPFLLGTHLARWLSALTGLMVERAWYLISAITYGLSFPLLVGLLRQIGFTHPASMFASGVALAAPLAWIGGTLPGALGLSLIGAIVLARALFSGSTSPWIYSALTSVAWFGASIADPENAYLWPVVGLAVWLSTSVSALRWHALSGPLLAGFLLAVLAPRTLQPSTIDFDWLVIGLYLLSLGATLLGLTALFFSRRLPEESPPPLWLRLWGLLALAPMFGAAFWTWGAAGAFVLPVAAIGIADWLDRRLRDGEVVRWGSTVLSAQIVITLVATGLHGEASESSRRWRSLARESLEPTDHVITPNEYHHYLLRYRWDVAVTLEAGTDPAVDVAALLAAHERGARVVLDRGWEDSTPDPPPEALESSGIAYQVLTLGGLVPGDRPWH